MKGVDAIMVERYVSPCGELLLGSYGDELCLCDWADTDHRKSVDDRVRRFSGASYEIGRSEVTAAAAAQLDEYFARRRREFDMPLRFFGTDFQRSVWRELMNIPYGVTVSYMWLAERLGDAKAVRAVASANGANPMSIFAPCHRVIGSDGRLVGYGGGLAAKRFLLDLEAGQGCMIG